MGKWPCNFFIPVEIACRGTDAIIIHEEALEALDEFRKELGGPVSISSGYRSPYHNAVVGGAPRSSHLEGHAFDVRLSGRDKGVLHRMAESLGFTGFGLNYHTFIHIDMGPRRAW